MKKLFLSFLLLTLTTLSIAQVIDPVHWSYVSKHLKGNNFEITFTAKIDDEFHIFSQSLPENATPNPTTFVFKPSKEYSLIGKTIESGKSSMIEDWDKTKLKIFEQKGIFKQEIKVIGNSATVSGTISYMKCDHEKCLPPDDFDFELKLEVPTDAMVPVNNVDSNGTLNSTTTTIAEASTNNTTSTDTSKKKKITIIQTNKDDIHGKSLWEIFLIGFGAGLLSLITPCVYSMIPLTVTFFTKRSGSRRRGILNAMVYAFSIVLIFVLIGFLLYLFGISGDTVNEFASNGIFNFVLFLLFIIFAISFFGVFEITLPASWINKTEQMSDGGGFMGIFFMAATLVLVSFSCTAPFVGSALALITQGHALGPIVGMFAYSLAFAFPFGLFAFFPNWLTSLPKSGGWLNMVKVSFAFVELALALKFLSNVDLAYHWHIFDREIFLVLWITIFLLLSFYLLGFIRFAHDIEISHLSITRLFFSISSLAFTFYMLPGLWGAPLNAISAFTPPLATQDFDLSRNQYQFTPTANSDTAKRKYGNTFHCPHGLDCYFDYAQGMAAAKAQHKPVFLDFTGWTCVNCRKMEASVWSKPKVLKRMMNDYIIISMYVDDRTELPENEQYISTTTNKKITTLGNKNSDFQASRYNLNSQPYYVLLDQNEKILAQPRGYNEDVDAYIKFLDDGLKEFETQKVK